MFSQHANIGDRQETQKETQFLAAAHRKTLRAGGKRCRKILESPGRGNSVAAFDALRDLATRVKGLRADLAAVLVGLDGERVPWIALCQGAALDRGLDARQVARLLRERLGGGGGGRSELAQGQGRDPAGREAVAAAFEEAPEAVFGG